MLSQQQNPSGLQHSSEQQMDSKENKSVNTTKPFCIRQYVLDAREKDIYNNWPFPDEYLKVCLKNGVSRVLPPFDPSNTVGNSSHVSKNCAEKENSDVGFVDKHSIETDGTKDNIEVIGDIVMDAEISEVSKKVIHLSLNCNKPEHGEGKGLSCNIVKHPLISKGNTSNTTPSLNHHKDQIVVALPSNKAFRNKRPRSKGRTKKRLVADILAEARPCALENIDGLKGSKWTIDPSIMPYGFGHKSVKKENFENGGEESMTSIQQDCRPVLKGGIQKAQHPRDDNEGSGSLFIKRRCVVKLKLNGSKSKFK